MTEIHLPDELIVRILINISYDSLPYYRNICSTWNRIIKILITKPPRNIPRTLDGYKPYSNLRKIKLWNSYFPIASQNPDEILNVLSGILLDIKHDFPQLKILDLRNLLHNVLLRCKIDLEDNQYMDTGKQIIDLCRKEPIHCIKVDDYRYFINGKLRLLGIKQYILLKTKTYEYHYIPLDNNGNCLTPYYLEKMKKIDTSQCISMNCQIDFKSLKNFTELVKPFISIKKIDVYTNPTGDLTDSFFDEKFISIFPKLQTIKANNETVYDIDDIILQHNIKINTTFELCMAIVPDYNDISYGNLSLFMCVNKLIITIDELRQMYIYYIKNFFDSTKQLFPNLERLVLSNVRTENLIYMSDYIYHQYIKKIKVFHIEIEQVDDLFKHIFCHLFKNDSDLQLTKIKVYIKQFVNTTPTEFINYVIQTLSNVFSNNTLKKFHLIFEYEMNTANNLNSENKKTPDNTTIRLNSTFYNMYTTYGTRSLEAQRRDHTCVVHNRLIKKY